MPSDGFRVRSEKCSKRTALSFMGWLRTPAVTHVMPALQVSHELCGAHAPTCPVADWAIWSAP